jgi:ACT domain-containing protein
MLKGGAKVRAAIREIGLSKSTVYCLKDQLSNIIVEFKELHLGVPLAQQVIKRRGSKAKQKLLESDYQGIFDACKDRKKVRRKQ